MITAPVVTCSELRIWSDFAEAKSAKKPGRDQFAKMIEYIESSSEPLGILAWHPDRLARNSVDGGKIIYLIDINRIATLRFPQFWFEPTPQGKFMLQVAFGQSKYFSDNLVENVKRGIRQKIRRGEWITLAPFGYVNNLKTKNIEPDKVKSRIIKRAFEEYATGTYTLKSLADFLADHGVVQKKGTPLAKVSVVKMLTNRAYLGFIKHRGGWHNENFEPILSPTLFEVVQKVLTSRKKPRKSKVALLFAFTGFARCGECGCAITAQYKLIITHDSKFFKKNELEKFTALAANSLALFKKEKGSPPCDSEPTSLELVSHRTLSVAPEYSSPFGSIMTFLSSLLPMYPARSAPSLCKVATSRTTSASASET